MSCIFIHVICSPTPDTSGAGSSQRAWARLGLQLPLQGPLSHKEMVPLASGVERLPCPCCLQGREQTDCSSPASGPTAPSEPAGLSRTLLLQDRGHIYRAGASGHTGGSGGVSPQSRGRGRASCPARGRRGPPLCAGKAWDLAVCALFVMLLNEPAPQAPPHTHCHQDLQGAVQGLHVAMLQGAAYAQHHSLANGGPAGSSR